ncbi:histidinol dehydrogenase [Rhizobium ruizarguesonis]|nr:histidinol dehydrogenase [Rhizobium ruizarguesonis]
MSERGVDDRLSDHIAAEHLEVHTRDPQAMAKKLRNYGSLFIGELASVVYSDKCCGTNHTLPTMAAGRYPGGLWVGSYVKICTHQWLDERGVAAIAPPAARQSATEGMEGHRRAAALRLPARPEIQRIEIRAASPVSLRISKCQIPHSDMRQQAGFSS